MKFHYDLHIHSCLSPCGDEDMTPINIVNMSVIKGLDVIAITDHNSIKNCYAAMEVAKDLPILVLPGMEVESKEEVHVLCLFKNIMEAEEFDKFITKNIPEIQLNESFFGEQVVCDGKGERVEKIKNLLSTSIKLSVNDIIKTAFELGGVAIPAHVDKSSYSIISNLGFIPFDLDIKTLEISKNTTKEAQLKKYPYLKNYEFIKNSDAHYLVDISERGNAIDLPELDAEALIKYLRGQR